MEASNAIRRTNMRWYACIGTYMTIKRRVYVIKLDDLSKIYSSNIIDRPPVCAWFSNWHKIANLIKRQVVLSTSTQRRYCFRYEFVTVKNRNRSDDKQRRRESSRRMKGRKRERRSRSRPLRPDKQLEISPKEEFSGNGAADKNAAARKEN